MCKLVFTETDHFNEYGFDIRGRILTVNYREYQESLPGYGRPGAETTYVAIDHARAEAARLYDIKRELVSLPLLVFFLNEPEAKAT